VIVERPDRHAPGQLRDAAVTIGMKVRDQQVIDARDPCVPHRGENPPGVPALRGVTGIDEQRLAGRRHDERRLSALDIDEIERQRVRGRSRRHVKHRGNKDRCDESGRHLRSSSCARLDASHRLANGVRHGCTVMTILATQRSKSNLGSAMRGKNRELPGLVECDDVVGRDLAARHLHSG
jgi:hypothetical protein